MPESAPRRVVSGRRDGLGGRLCALLNTIRTAKALGWPYAFIWPRLYNQDTHFHAVDDPAQTFAEDYLKAHLMHELDPEGFIEVVDDTLDSDIPRCVADDNCHGLVIRCWASQLRLPMEAPPLHECIADIAFHPDIVAVREHVGAMQLSRHCAIHLRRGDIVYGENRYGLYNDKYIPVGVLKRVIAFLAEHGSRVLLVSEDAELSAYLGERYDITIASDAARQLDLSLLQRAFFDIFTIAHCGRVMGRGSAFSHAAALIGGAPYVDLLDFFQRVSCARATLEDLDAHSADYHPFQIAKEAFYVTRLDVLPPERAEEQYRRAITSDPDNDTYTRFFSHTLVESERFDELEQLWRETSERTFTRVRRNHTHFITIMRRYDRVREETLARRAAERAPTPYICSYYAYILERRRAWDDALPFARRAHEDEPNSMLLLVRLAHLLMQGKRTQEAWDLLRDYNHVCAEIPILRALRGDAAGARGDHERAAREYIAAFALAPDAFRYAARAAAFLLASGRRDECDIYMSVAVAGGGNHPTVRYWQSKVAEKQHDFESALRAIQIAHQLRPDKANYLARMRTLTAKLASKA